MYPYYIECQISPFWVQGRQTVNSRLSEVGVGGFAASDDNEVVYEATTSSVRLLSLASVTVSATIAQASAVQTLTAAKGGAYLAVALGSKNV